MKQAAPKGRPPNTCYLCKPYENLMRTAINAMYTMQPRSDEHAHQIQDEAHIATRQYAEHKHRVHDTTPRAEPEDK